MKMSEETIILAQASLIEDLRGFRHTNLNHLNVKSSGSQMSLQGAPGD